MIPVAHSRAAHHVLPSSRLEIFEGAGHFTHVEQPARFAGLLDDFLATSTPAPVDPRSMRRRLRAGGQMDSPATGSPAATAAFTSSCST